MTGIEKAIEVLIRIRFAFTGFYLSFKTSYKIKLISRHMEQN